MNSEKILVSFPSNKNRISGNVHKLPVRVYFEDTDAAGIVYYANYLKFFERGRTDFMRSIGFLHSDLLKKKNIYFVVRKCVIKFSLPASLDELLIVNTSVKKVRRSIIDFEQEIFREEKAIVSAQIRVVSVGSDGKLKKLPDNYNFVLKKATNKK